MRVGIPIFSFLGFVGSEVFSILFGDNWGGAGAFAEILSVLLFVRFITIPSFYLILTLEKQEYGSFINISVLIISSISLIVGGRYGTVNFTILLYTIMNSFVYLMFGLYIMRKVELGYVKSLQIILKNTVIAIPLIVILGIAKAFVGSSTVILVFISSIALTAHLLLVLITSKDLKFMVFTLFASVKRKIGG